MIHVPKNILIIVALYALIHIPILSAYTYTFDNLTPYPLFISITGVAAIPSAKGSMFGEKNPDGSIRAKLVESGDSIEFHGTGWELGICLDSIRIKFVKKIINKNETPSEMPTSYHPITEQLIDPNVAIIVLPNAIYTQLGNTIEKFTTTTAKNIDTIAALIANAALVAETGSGLPTEGNMITTADILKDSISFGFDLYKYGMCRNRVFRIIETVDKPNIIRKGKLIQREEKSLKIITSE